jgi:2,4-dienoyl-CoA reductase-like NADH-dependent reductase (Old Yellow Enzyme family)
MIALTPQQIAHVLSAPVRINQLKLRNRLIMGPMAAHGAAKDGRPGKQTIAFFEARARGGVAMIIVGGINTTERSLEEIPALGLRFDIDTFIPDLRRVADAVHAQGVPIIAELLPSLGRMAFQGRRISASPINVVMREDRFPQGFQMPGGYATPMPEEASIAEIEKMEREMINAAERVHRSGWDGVEIAAHMSYFAASFLSPRTNWRTDQYGGSVENRARMLVNIVTGIRQRLGPDFVVGLRITANDFVPDSQGPAGFAAIAKQVETAGIDYVALSPGCYEAMDKAMPAVDGDLIDNGDSRVFKKTLSVPVLLQGLHDTARAAQAIAGGHGDMVMLARQMLADPEYARKACEGRIDEIVRCDRDNQCLRRLMLGMPIRCSVNPRMGRESRSPGRLPPFKRLVQAPAEKLILGLTSSKWFMELVGLVRKKRA